MNTVTIRAGVGTSNEGDVLAVLVENGGVISAQGNTPLAKALQQRKHSPRVDPNAPLSKQFEQYVGGHYSSYWNVGPVTPTVQHAEFGDLPGHTFHGNQHTGGLGAALKKSATGHEWGRMVDKWWGETTASSAEINQARQDSIEALNKAGYNGEDVEKAVRLWSGGEVDSWRNEWNNPGDTSYWGSNRGSSSATEATGDPLKQSINDLTTGIKDGIDVIEHTKIDEPLYRGVVMSKDALKGVVPGATFPGQLSSWSRDARVAKGFAEIDDMESTSRERGESTSTEKVILSTSGVHGLDIAALGRDEYAWQQEVIVGERNMKVASVSRYGDSLKVALEPS